MGYITARGLVRTAGWEFLALVVVALGEVVRPSRTSYPPGHAYLLFLVPMLAVAGIALLGLAQRIPAKRLPSGPFLLVAGLLYTLSPIILWGIGHLVSPDDYLRWISVVGWAAIIASVPGIGMVAGSAKVWGYKPELENKPTVKLRKKR